MKNLQIGRSIDVGSTYVILDRGDDHKYMIVCGKHGYLLEGNNKEALWSYAKYVETDWCDDCKNNAPAVRYQV